ncbi:MAG: hypothetical protein WBH84_02750 [Defluviitoga tunisiensis]|jgi:23S rRNA (adenine-N6)-dimethyltransferase|nr:hypothetical protein [Defluviitoga tunisiensis]MDY0378942.1 hypothetical protein [Defluviitoga tunisiensis]HHV01618.1 hypothetical protein [Defluviitoga tunisiensis]HOB55480.1 hypothetical protein [Defluviitoga tunisiensis]HOK16134.1 hypothetical protein [Defluviitoga tunisiensis]
MNTEIITSALTLSRSNYENSDVKEVSEAFVANIFSKILNDFQDNELIKDSKLIPESNAEKWLKELINIEYANLIVKQSMQPLVQEIIKAFPPQR